jgi:hypothetical protein
VRSLALPEFRNTRAARTRQRPGALGNAAMATSAWMMRRSPVMGGSLIDQLHRVHPVMGGSRCAAEFFARGGTVDAQSRATMGIRDGRVESETRAVCSMTSAGRIVEI